MPRWLGAGGLLWVLLLMGWWAWMVGTEQVGLGEAAHHPVDGEPVMLSLVMVREVQGPDQYLVEKGTLRFVVRGPTAALWVGQELSVGGELLHGRVVESWRAPAPGRRAKKVLGLLALLFLGAAVPRWFEVRASGLVPRG